MTANLTAISSPTFTTPLINCPYPKIVTDPLVVSVASSIFATGFWAVCGPSLLASGIASPLTLMGLGAIYLVSLGSYIYNHRKEIIYEVSLLGVIALNALCPNTYSWWNKIDEGLYLGAIPIHQHKHFDNIPKELKGKIAILSLLEPFEFLDQYILTTSITHPEWQKQGVLTKVLPAIDQKAVSQDHIKEGVQFIHNMRRQGRTVYVHCKAGVGRSATVIACYLLKFGLASGKKFSSPEEAIQHVKKIRKHVSIPRNPAKSAILEFYRGIQRNG